MSVAVSAQRLAVSGASDQELQRLARREALALSSDELRSIAQRIGRDPTRAEAHAFAIQWSEHCSYKSSRPLLRALPTKSADVLVGVGEDAGILRAGTANGVEYGVVVAHESHNHPSQVVPFEGAATGVGGILRDVLCMGAEVVASADPLRFGMPLAGSHAAYVAGAAVDGIAAYGNAVGVPNLAGDVYFHDSFKENCLVNVVALGIVPIDRIIHSRVPPDGAGYDLVLVGKATDASGFGGAAFASLVLDASLAQSNKSAVQVPDPFLKSVLMRASYAVFDEVRARGVLVGFKDLGAGGIMGSSCELANAGGFGAEIDIDAVPVAVSGLPPFVIACAETQERMLWAVPPAFTPELLEIYNVRFTLPHVSANARAAVIGKVTSAQRYVVRAGRDTVIDVPIDVLAGPIVVPRVAMPPSVAAGSIRPASPSAFSERTATELLLAALSHPDVCSRRPLIEHYDRFVRGATVIPAGYADAGVFIIKRGARAGIALSVDGNPRYGAISPRLAAAHAVVEAARNVAAVGAQPIGLTDCLNYGNPEDPIAYWQLSEGVAGLAEAANALRLNAPGEPLPFVSGNVSLYNESAARAISPSAIVACVGRVDDVGKVVTMQLTAEGDPLFLFGPRTPHTAGSVLLAMTTDETRHVAPGDLPPLDYAEANASIRAVIAAIGAGVVKAAHDISDGGLAVCATEMCLGGDGRGTIGVTLLEPLEWAPSVSSDVALFGETPGFVAEVSRDAVAAFEEICKTTGARPMRIGTTGGSRIMVEGSIDIGLGEAADAWLTPLVELYA